MIKSLLRLMALAAALAVAGCSGPMRAVMTGDPSALGRPAPDPQALIGATPAPFRVIDPTSGGEIWGQTFVRRLISPDVDLVILGEVHDNPNHHALQAWLVETLNALRPRGPFQPTELFGGVQGLAFEMMPEAREAEVNAPRDWRPGLPRPGEAERASAEIGEILDWPHSGWPDWAYYAPILTNAPQAYIAGGGVERDELMRLAREGAASDPLAARYGLDQPLPPSEQAAREAGQIAAHCNAIPPEAAKGMVTAQRVRDARFAEALLRARKEGNGFSVLITGNGHARADWAVPRLLRRAAPTARVLSVAMLEAAPGEPLNAATLAAQFDAARAPFDYVIVTAPATREDPCEAFLRNHGAKN